MERYQRERSEIRATGQPDTKEPSARKMIDYLSNAGKRAKNRQYCVTCKWYDTELGVCCNGESEHRADFRDWNDWCSKWEGYA